MMHTVRKLYTKNQGGIWTLTFHDDERRFFDMTVHYSMHI